MGVGSLGVSSASGLWSPIGAAVFFLVSGAKLGRSDVEDSAKAETRVLRGRRDLYFCIVLSSRARKEGLRQSFYGGASMSKGKRTYPPRLLLEIWSIWKYDPVLVGEECFVGVCVCVCILSVSSKISVG